VTSATADFAFHPATPQAAIVPNPRRQVVDIAKCMGCHDGGQHGDTTVPRLSLHGGNRNQNLNLCVMCHNANQTDVPYRYIATDPLISGPETAVDFKTMVHSIHSGGFRETPFVVIGRSSSINDYGDVRFPSTLRNCLNCHVENAGKGSYELPLNASVLGTTTATGSVYNVPAEAMRSIDVNPANDVKTSPTAAVCSSCHDKAEVRSHMTRRGGASFSTTQSAIGVTVRERCASCHGPGKDKDVKKVHEVGRSGSSDEHDD
jgi:OmcA/MtrC family decaheme c-type cytochrome